MGRSRRAGRAGWRLWDRHGRQLSAPVRERWAIATSYAWFVGYSWIGLLLSVAAARLLGTRSPLTTIVCVAGGAVLGYWQSRDRLLRHADPARPPIRGSGLAICAWLGVIGLALLIET